ncbi:MULTISPECIES: YnbE family lipoprotein [Proteus]|uniref:Lipoprotein n=1 Tax=Proteus vulgaris TaxID=585 RepID=A0A379FDS9_PROVU|nr:YnbE family lipoprotein [Proteus vulgaris]MBI6510038.1 YnbE family lipoprotein [Proteus sp. PR00174]NBN46940.1 YnbE family lipoprotein [Proteus sp. G2626]NBN60773.1 YnbE family lipoprotein [Proteus sp. G2639]NBN76355.1 YnbE family lipoprotein [Proteus sp. G2615]NBN86362.1 YnbE family lipoprotein [Proteus sp. G2300]RNT29066.1 YnbE family lipoprotein [Proteus mirabilis]
MKPLFLRKLFILTALIMGISALTGCIRLEVATPDKPININMNVKIEHEINVKIDRQVEDLLKNNSAIF